MLNAEYQHIIDKIKYMDVEPPTDKTLDELNDWIEGYTQCRKSILKIIEEAQQMDNIR